MSLVVLLLIILLLFGGLGVAPRWGYSSGWGWGPSGLIGVILLVVIVLAVAGRL